jgi:hypothetical protein
MSHSNPENLSSWQNSLFKETFPEPILFHVAIKLPYNGHLQVVLADCGHCSFAGRRQSSGNPRRRPAPNAAMQFTKLGAGFNCLKIYNHKICE